MKWYDHLRVLQQSDATPSDRPQGPCSELAVVAAIRSAAAAAKQCPIWKECGVHEMLLNALQIAEQGDCRGAVQSAVGVLAFLQGRESALNRRLQGGKLPWDTSAGSAVDALAGSEVLHMQADDANDPHGHHIREQHAAAAVREVTAAEAEAERELGSNKRLADELQHNLQRKLRKVVSDPHYRAQGQKREEVVSPAHHPHGVPRSLSDPITTSDDLDRDQEQASKPTQAREQQPQQQPQPQQQQQQPLPLEKQQQQQQQQQQHSRSMDSLILVAGNRPRTGAFLESGSNSANHLGSIASDDKFPGHNCIEDVQGDGNVFRKAKLGDVDRASGSFWAGKVKHKLGASVVELFFLSVLLPPSVIEHMPLTLFVTDLAQRSSLTLDEFHSVVRCRLDFLTNRQMRKLRALADLRLAAVSTLQHSSLTLVPFVDAIGGLRIIGFVKVESA